MKIFSLLRTVDATHRDSSNTLNLTYQFLKHFPKNINTFRTTVPQPSYVASSSIYKTRWKVSDEPELECLKSAKSFPSFLKLMINRWWWVRYTTQGVKLGIDLTMSIKLRLEEVCFLVVLRARAKQTKFMTAFNKTQTTISNFVYIDSLCFSPTYIFISLSILETDRARAKRTTFLTSFNHPHPVNFV